MTCAQEAPSNSTPIPTKQRLGIKLGGSGRSHQSASADLDAVAWTRSVAVSMMGLQTTVVCILSTKDALCLGPVVEHSLHNTILAIQIHDSNPRFKHTKVAKCCPNTQTSCKTTSNPSSSILQISHLITVAQKRKRLENNA
ncbi:hypothetical protein HDV57DRAFT_497406 [Trichoderma longibrachiatum]